MKKDKLITQMVFCGK